MKAASQDIAAFKSSPLEVWAQMVAKMASKLVKATAKINRAGDAGFYRRYRDQCSDRCGK